MMKKTILIAVVALLMLAFAATMVSAGPNTGRMHSFMGGQTNLTDVQKEEMAPYFSKMNDLHLQMIEVKKEMIQKQVSLGYITQEDADQHLTRMQERMEQGAGGMMGRGTGKMGRGPGGNGCPMSQQQPVSK